MEFVHFDYYDLARDERFDLFPVPSLIEMINHKQKFKVLAVDSLAIISDIADAIVNEYAPELLDNVLQHIKNNSPSQLSY